MPTLPRKDLLADSPFLGIFAQNESIKIRHILSHPLCVQVAKDTFDSLGLGDPIEIDFALSDQRRQQTEADPRIRFDETLHLS